MIETRLDGHPVEQRSIDDLRAWTSSHGLLWMNASPASPDDIKFLEAGLRLHPLVIEDIENRNQRPKADEYDEMMFVVLFTTLQASDKSLHLAEVHVLVGNGWIATVSDATIPSLDQLWSACDKRPEIAAQNESMVFYRICDTLVDSFFPVLDTMDEGLERIENNIVTRGGMSTVSEIFRLKRDMTVLRRVLGPERDLLQQLAGPRTPRLDAEAQLYLRDVHDHAVRMVEQLDSYRDIITGALDVYLSSVSNRLGEQTRRLTVVATIFLPLTFLTGFFGMNFAVLVNAISTPLALLCGLIAMTMSVAAVVAISQRLTARASPLGTDEAASPRGRLHLPSRSRRGQRHQSAMRH
ncbi:MAG: magnesium transporter CorA family protein [Candidatus Dormibacteria bacterium]